MGIYRDLARNQGILRVVASQLLARLPFGMLSIILLLHVQQAFGDFTSAGTVLAAMSVGQAVSGPLSSRLMSRFGIRQVLTPTSLVCGTLLVTISFARLPLAAVMALSLVIGVTTPPVAPAVRTLYPKLVPGSQLSALFSLDAAAQELIWVLGPVIAVFLASQFGTAVGLCAGAGIMLVGGAWFILSPAVGRVRLPPSKYRFGAVLRYPTVTLTTIIGIFFLAAMASVEAGVVAAFAGGGGGDGAHASMESGIVLAIFSIGSLGGGLLMGHRELRPWSLLLRVTLVFVGMLAALASLNMWWLSATLFVAGLGVAPAFAALSNIVAATVRFSETVEAFGWVGMGHLVGIASGSALAGTAIDLLGARGGVLVSTGMLVAAALCAAGAIRWLPDLKGRTIEAPPDTGPLTISRG